MQDILRFENGYEYYIGLETTYCLGEVADSHVILFSGMAISF